MLVKNLLKYVYNKSADNSEHIQRNLKSTCAKFYNCGAWRCSEYETNIDKIDTTKTVLTSSA
jgi:hypothetical protein